MKFVILFGPPAVGKMTVGQHLGQSTGFKLFHNHMSIELVLNFFEYGTESFSKLNSLFRQKIFEEVAVSDLKGLIFTFVWALDEESEKDYIDSISEIFSKNGAEVYYVELVAAIEKRLKRNKEESRLIAKPSKRDVEKSEERLLKNDKQYRLNSNDNNPFFYSKNYLKIDNTNLSAEAVAEKIRTHFNF